MSTMKRAFLDKHGPKIGAALCTLSTLVVFGGMVWLFIMAVAE